MIYKRGKKGTYWFRFRFAGRFVHESARTKSKTLARDAERQRRRELEQTWNKIERRTLPPSFETAADSWLEHVKPHLAERTKDIYDVALRCHLKAAVGRLLLCDIDSREIAAYQSKRKVEHASARTLNKQGASGAQAGAQALSHIRMVAKRAALEGITKQAVPTNIEAGVNQNVHQVSASAEATAPNSLN